MAEPALAVLNDVTVELACFAVSGQLVGIDVMQVREIVRPQETTPLPNAPSLIEGVIDLRGSVIPVVDLALALGAPQPCRGESARIAVLEVDEMVFGLRVEAAVDVVSAAAGDVEEPPALATQSGYEAVRAVVRREGAAPVMVLSLEHLLERIYRSGMRGGREE